MSDRMMLPDFHWRWQKPRTSPDLELKYCKQGVFRGLQGHREPVRRKWGSCSSKGIVTLASDLVDEDVRFQDFVIAHELLHLRVPNHGRLFKALMSAHVPSWRAIEPTRHRSRGVSRPVEGG